MPYVVRQHPSQPHEFLAGVSNKILQYDTRTPQKPTQTYDYHTDTVKTIVFCGTRFITSSDDRTVRPWEYGIPVPLQLIADPSMFSLVRAALHPNGTTIAYQSMNNSILTFKAGDKLRQDRKKVFMEHRNAGDSVGLDFSPDGRFLASGDSRGSICVWNTKDCTIQRELSAHKGACTSVAWSPRESSKLASGGQDGELKLFD